MKLVVSLVSLLLIVSTAFGQAQAQTFPPNALLRLVVGYPAGGGLDSATRVLAEKIRATADFRIIVENKPGAASLVAAQAVASAAPDGLTLLVAPISVTAVHPFIFKDMTFDPNTDLVPVAEMGVFQYGLAVNNDVPAKTLREFIDWAKQRPGKVNFASLGKGSFSQLVGLVFINVAGLDMSEIPYRGSAPGLLDLHAGTIQATFDTNASLVEQHRSGTLRILAVTGSSRLSGLPDVPTFAEGGLKGNELSEAEFWYGVFVPKNTPKPIIDALNAAIVGGLKMPGLAERFETLGIVPRFRSADDFAATVKADTVRWEGVVRQHRKYIDER